MDMLDKHLVPRRFAVRSVDDLAVVGVSDPQPDGTIILHAEDEQGSAAVLLSPATAVLLAEFLERQARHAPDGGA